MLRNPDVGQYTTTYNGTVSSVTRFILHKTHLGAVAFELIHHMFDKTVTLGTHVENAGVCCHGLTTFSINSWLEMSCYFSLASESQTTLDGKTFFMHAINLLHHIRRHTKLLKT